MTTVIRYPNGDVPLDDEDRLWTARMLDGEGAHTEAEAALVIWTLIQRRYWGVGMERANPGAFAGYRSWARFIRTFSQPINPEWYQGGSKCGPGGREVGTRGCAEERLARRAELARTPFERLDALAQKVANDFAAGRLARPAGAVGVIDFRARDNVQVNRPLATFPFPTANRYFYSVNSASVGDRRLAAIRFMVDGVEQTLVEGWGDALMPESPPGIGGVMLNLVPGAVKLFNNLAKKVP